MTSTISVNSSSFEEASRSVRFSVYVVGVGLGVGSDLPGNGTSPAFADESRQRASREIASSRFMGVVTPTRKR